MSSAEKSEIKAAAAHDIGVRVDDLLEEAQREAYRASGAQAALLDAAKMIQKLHEHVDKDVSDGAYDLVAAKWAKVYVTRAMAAVESMSQRANNIQLAAQGRVQGLQEVVRSVKSFHDLEVARAAAPPPVNVPGTGEPARPGPTVKEIRQAEDREKADTVPPPAPPKKKRKPRK
jgi:hypothetical protein